MLKCLRLIIFIHTDRHTGSRLQRVRLQRAPAYSERIPLHQNHWQQCLKVWLLREPSYKEQFSLHLFARSKRDPPISIKMGAESNGNLHRSLTLVSQQDEHLHTIVHKPFFIDVCFCLGVYQCKLTRSYVWWNCILQFYSTKRYCRRSSADGISVLLPLLFDFLRIGILRPSGCNEQWFLSITSMLKVRLQRPRPVLKILFPKQNGIKRTGLNNIYVAKLNLISEKLQCHFHSTTTFKIVQTIADRHFVLFTSQVLA